MKAIFYFIFSLLVISFTSCTEEEDIEQMIKSNKISFFVERDNNYKGTILTTTNFSKFNVYAYSSPNAMSPTTSLSSYINNLIVTKSTSSWNYTGAYYWPEDGFVQFFAVASDTNAAGVSNWTIGSTGYPSFSFATNTITANQKDLVVAKSLNKTYSNSPTGVAMDFKHILTKINISFKKSKQAARHNMTKIELLNVETSAIYSFDSINGAWNSLTNTKNLIYWQGSQIISGASYTNLNENMFIIPQSTITLRFTFTKNGNQQTPQDVIISPNQIGGNLRYNVVINI